MPLTNEEKAKRITVRLQHPLVLGDTLPLVYSFRWRKIEETIRHALDTMEEEDSQPWPQSSSALLGQGPGIDY